MLHRQTNWNCAGKTVHERDNRCTQYWCCSINTSTDPIIFFWHNTGPLWQTKCKHITVLLWQLRCHLKLYTKRVEVRWSFPVRSCPNKQQRLRSGSTVSYALQKAQTWVWKQSGIAVPTPPTQRACGGGVNTITDFKRGEADVQWTLSPLSKTSLTLSMFVFDINSRIRVRSQAFFRAKSTSYFRLDYLTGKYCILLSRSDDWNLLFFPLRELKVPARLGPMSAYRFLIYLFVILFKNLESINQTDKFSPHFRGYVVYMKH